MVIACRYATQIILFQIDLASTTEHKRRACVQDFLDLLTELSRDAHKIGKAAIDDRRDPRSLTDFLVLFEILQEALLPNL